MCKAGCSHGCVVIKDARVDVKDSNAARARRALAHLAAALAEIDAMPDRNIAVKELSRRVDNVNSALLSVAGV